MIINVLSRLVLSCLTVRPSRQRMLFPMKMALLLLKLFLEKINEIHEYVGFFKTYIFHIYFASAISLVFMFGSFSLLSTFKTIAKTKYVNQNLKAQTT